MIAAHRPSPVFGLGYALWIRGKSSFAVAWLLIGVLAVLATVPIFGLSAAFGGGLKMPPITFAVPIVVLPIVALLNVFTYGPIDVSAKASPFPMHARLLPLSTRALVGWPMLFAALTIGSLWGALLAFVLRPLHITTSILWPTTVVVACTLWAQAIAWAPLPYRFLRVPMFLAFVGIPLLFATLDPRQGDAFWQFEGAMAAWGVAAYAFAATGLARARVGATERVFGVRPSEAPGATATTPHAVASPFASASIARRWYELRRTTSFFAKAFALTPVPLVALCVLALAYPSSVFAHRIDAVPIASVWSIIYLVIGPLLVSAAMGGYVGRFGNETKAGLGSFFGLRPVSTARMVADKLVSAGLAALVLLASSALVAGFALWAFFAHAPPKLGAALERWYAHGAAADIATVAVLFALLLWRNLSVGLWTTMTGRTWPSRVVATYSALTIAVLPVTLASFKGDGARIQAAVDLLSLLVRVGLVAKLAATVVVAHRLVRRDIVSPRTIAAFAAGWLVANAIVLALVSRFADLSIGVACVVALLVPAARIGLAPLALDKSRHG